MIVVTILFVILTFGILNARYDIRVVPLTTFSVGISLNSIFMCVCVGGGAPEFVKYSGQLSCSVVRFNTIQ